MSASGSSQPPTSARPDETERIRRIYEKEAAKFDRSMGRWERFLFTGNREWACSQAIGHVLEIAVGTGRNLPYYSSEVRLIGIELSPAMLEIARSRAAELGREVDLRVGDAEALDLPDASLDTVVCTFSLCTIPDDRAAVREAKRVLKSGGKFILAEHVRSPVAAVRIGQRLIDPLAVRFGGDHIVREPLDHLQAEGFEIETLERSKLGIVELTVARKP